MKIVILSSSLFTERILLYSSFCDSIPEHLVCEVWSTSYPINKKVYESKGLVFRTFPNIHNFKERYNIIRQINNFAWAFHLNAASILSMRNFQLRGFNTKQRLRRHFEGVLSKLLAAFKLVDFCEYLLLNALKNQSRSLDAYNRLLADKPEMLVVTNPFWMHESAVAIEAKKLGIPIFSFIPSWDNISTKSRFVFNSDFYAVWSDEQKEQLGKYYPRINSSQVFSVGAPQYDVFINCYLETSKFHFYKRNSLKPNLPVVLYALGSPNFIKSEFETCRQFLMAALSSGTIEKFQVLVRPHPNKDSNSSIDNLALIHENIHIQVTTKTGIEVEQRSQTESDIVDWVETFKFCDVLINLSSTCIFDAAYQKKPIININFDHTERGVYDFFIKEINNTWEHLRVVFDSDALYVANSIPELCKIVMETLTDSEAKVHKQEFLLRKLCNNTDGRSGRALMDAIEDSLDLLQK